MSSKYLIFCFLFIFLSLCYALPLNSEENDHRYHAGVEKSENNFGPVKLIGGKSAKIKQHPYQVAILINGTFIGSGIIVAKTWVVTLASMLVNIESVSDIIIKAGKDQYTKGKSYKIQTKIVHPDFNFYSLDSDIALLKTNNIKFTSSIRSISIANKTLSNKDPVIVSGWGQSSINKTIKESIAYKEIALNVVDRESCSQIYTGYEISNTMMCAYHKNAGPCWNDFGDILIDKKTKNANGLFSWSDSCSTDTPSVYTDLFYFKDWINQYIKGKKHVEINLPLYVNNIQQEDKQNIEENNDNKKTISFASNKIKNPFNENTKLVFKNHHLLSKRSVDSFLDNVDNNNNIEKEIQDAIKAQEDEESKADEEEEQQVMEEDEAEKNINENENQEDREENEKDKYEEEENIASDESPQLAEEIEIKQESIVTDNVSNEENRYDAKSYFEITEDVDDNGAEE